MKPQTRQAPNNPLHVLLIDDDQDDHLLFSEALHSLKLDAVCAAPRDGVAVLEALRDGSFEVPSLIFLDLNMPRVNGFEVLKVLKQTPETAQVPVIIYSTSSSATDIARSREGGASGYMMKHSNFRHLCRDLEETLKNYTPPPEHEN